MDLLAVLTEGTSTTSTVPLAQNIVELYGLLPTVADDVDLNPFPSKPPFTASSRGLACTMDLYGRA